MQIYYTVKNYQFRETTKGKGIIKYYLVDDQGKERVVSAIAKLGFTNKIKSVHPIHHRETPLIDVLSKAAIDERILVDFTEYNNKYPRADRGPKKITAQSTRVIDPYTESLITDMSSITKNKMRIIKLVALSLLVFTAYLFVRQGFFS